MAWLGTAWLGTAWLGAGPAPARHAGASQGLGRGISRGFTDLWQKPMEGAQEAFARDAYSIVTAYSKALRCCNR